MLKLIGCMLQEVLQQLFSGLGGGGGGGRTMYTQTLGKLINNMRFHRKARNFLEQLKIFGALLDKIQGDYCHLYDAAHI